MPEGVRVSGNLREKSNEFGQEHRFPKARPCQPLGPPLLWGARSEQPFLKAAMAVKDGMARLWAIPLGCQSRLGLSPYPPGKILPHWSMVFSPGLTGYPMLPDCPHMAGLPQLWLLHPQPQPWHPALPSRSAPRAAFSEACSGLGLSAVGLVSQALQPPLD